MKNPKVKASAKALAIAKQVTGVKGDCVFRFDPLDDYESVISFDPLEGSDDGTLVKALYTPPGNSSNPFPGKHLIELNSTMPAISYLGGSESVWHELRHAWQYEVNFPRPRPAVPTFEAYESLPHEIDARDWAHQCKRKDKLPLVIQCSLRLRLCAMSKEALLGPVTVRNTDPIFF